MLLVAQDEAEANELLSALELAGLSSTKRQRGAQFEVTVPAGKVPESWRALRAQGLPWRRGALPLEPGLWEGASATAVRLRERRAARLAETLEGWRAIRAVRLHLSERAGAAFIRLNRSPGPLLRQSIEAFIRDGAPLPRERPLTLKLQGPQPLGAQLQGPRPAIMGFIPGGGSEGASGISSPLGLWEWLSAAPLFAILLLFSSLLFTVIAYFWGARQPIIISPSTEPRSSPRGEAAHPPEPARMTQDQGSVE